MSNNKWKPQLGDYYYCVDFSDEEKVYYCKHQNLSYDQNRIKHGVAFKTKKEAINCANKMLQRKKRVIRMEKMTEAVIGSIVETKVGFKGTVIARNDNLLEIADYKTGRIITKVIQNKNKFIKIIGFDNDMNEKMGYVMSTVQSTALKKAYKETEKEIARKGVN